MKNKAIERATHVDFTMLVAANLGLGPLSGDPLMIGVMSCVCSQDYTPPNRTTTGRCNVDMEGACFLEVTAASTISPIVGLAILPGDPIYAVGGTLDAITNVLYGFTLCNDVRGIYFGNALDAIAAALTATIRVKLPGAKEA